MYFKKNKYDLEIQADNNLKKWFELRTVKEAQKIYGLNIILFKNK